MPLLRDKMTVDTGIHFPSLCRAGCHTKQTIFPERNHYSEQ